MNKKKKLEIKHPHLRKIRDTLRYVIVEETYERLSNLISEQRKYSIEEKEKLIPLVREEQALRRALDASVCICTICKSQASDMIYNPQLKKWYCVNCYEHNQYYYKHSPNSTERKDAPNPFP
ncbi:MAG: hypothetical protein GF311_18200 [Candidatus Lokiarchaeota archaeon]|nr:hypothetical protein [Candidatus Lokiarchaeota archaeon]